MRPTVMELVTGVVCSLTAVVAARAAGPVGKVPHRSLAITGSDSHVTKCRYQRITSAEEWTRVWQEHIGEKPAGHNDRTLAPLATPRVDFDKYMVIAVFQGESWNCGGLTDVSVSEEDNRVVFQFSSDWYQTSDGANKVTVYGFFAVPRSTKPVVAVEELHFMDDPPESIERITLPKLASDRRQSAGPEEHTWTSITGNGDKSRIGIVLTENAGKVISARLHIFDPKYLGDSSKGPTYALKIVDQHDKLVRAETSVIDGSTTRWTQNLHVTIVFEGPFEGDRVQAEVQDGSKQTTVFFRRTANRAQEGRGKTRG